MARRRSWQRARCLVTGSSSGLGKALAEHLVRLGARVVLTGRSSEKLAMVARPLIEQGADPASVITVAADLTRPDDLQRLFTVAADRLGALDLVINSAGVGATGQFDSHEPGIVRQMFEINVFSLIEVTRAALPMLRRGEFPALVNVGSIVARRALPGRSEYSASKFAVAGFTESIRAEWSRFGIHVLLLNPGFTNTDFERNALVDTARYSVTKRRTMTADQVAVATLRALRRGRNEVTLTLPGRILLVSNRLVPRFVDWGFGLWVLRLFPDAPVHQSRESKTR